MNAAVPASEVATLEVSVVMPLEDPRGDIVEHLRTWTHGQRFPRERYQVVVGANGEHPEFERGVAELLAPQDQLVTVPGATFTELYAAAAQAAQAPVLLITEAHCQAEPTCLAAVAEAFAGDPEIDGVTLEVRQSPTTSTGELTERWVTGVLDSWKEAGWPRLNFAGAAVRTEAYERAGGLDPRLELYAPSLMSARLHEQGARFAHLDGVAITHELEEGMSDPLWASRSWTRGECLARRENDPEFCRRYFGSAGLWDRRHEYRPEIARATAMAVVSAARHSPRDSAWLARELTARLPAGVAGTRPRRAWERVATRWHQTLAATPLIPVESRWRSYQTAQRRTVHGVQLGLGAAEEELPPPLGAGGTLGAERLDGVLIGAHEVEDLDGRPFRWTAPVSMLRLSPPPEGATLRIETGGMRGAPLDYLQGVHAGGRRLPRELITGDSETLAVRLPAEYARDAAERGLVLICHPLVPSREGSSDRRRLGMPVTGLELTAD
jgi:hypothetical protein